MFRPAWYAVFWPALTLAAVAFLATAARAESDITFNRDIRPIFSDNCFTCHGPDNNLRKADLRLDQPDGLYADKDGYKIITPGDPAKSELFARITAEGVGHMPPRRSNKTLKKEQVELIRRWIEQGGEYQGHWSFIAAKRPELPPVKNAGWVRNPIDRFILARLEKEGLEPSQEADRRTLIRRLSFDLTGLPPTAEQVDAFLKDGSPDAYERLVDRLLDSPHIGERMAVYWLDVVRYADSGGYHSDNDRDVWMYRDYVIQAFNKNKPFDRFVTEQLAGDLLPNATAEQRIASGFNRLLQTTEEGGAQPKEYAAKYQADRVRNTGTIFLGLTTGCAECHDHKFDPMTTKEFYEFAAFFADIQERPVGRQQQTPFPTPEQQRKLTEIDAKIAALQKVIDGQKDKLAERQAGWEARAKEEKYQGVPGNVAAVLKVEPGKRNAQQKDTVRNHYLSIDEGVKDVYRDLKQAEAAKQQLQQHIPTTLVSISGPPRTVRVLPRGNWLDDSGEVVQPDVPESILPLKADGTRPSRLDLAEWLLDSNNPLTSRVFVNRLWQLFYGQGIVKTADDFGSQGAWPTHPELLDWLAVEFREPSARPASGVGAAGGPDVRSWDVHHMIKLMVTSSTYRQTSVPGAALLKRDPYNLLLARQGRFRLPAEMVRDNALAISGLLNPTIGGPSVKPYQPAGYWQHLNFPKREWTPAKGADQYRRGLYTWWQRTFLHPSLMAFDAPSREECTVQRPRSNTPQQALALLNDPTYVEAARAFAEKILRTGGSDADARIAFAFREALQRGPEADELDLLRGLYREHLGQYTKDAKAAQALLGVGFRPVPQDLPAAELAATTSVARVILNLHETITRE